MIETTLNIHLDILDEITRAAEVLDTSRTEIIILLLKKVMDNDVEDTFIDNSVRYQDCCDKDCWHRFHISLCVADYNFFLNLRLLLKSSVSRIVAFAVKKYLAEILKYNDSTDNYHYKYYILNTKIKNNYRKWQIQWERGKKNGVPDRKT